MIWYEQYSDIAENARDLINAGYSLLKHTDDTYCIYKGNQVIKKWISLDEMKKAISKLHKEVI